MILKKQQLFLKIKSHMGAGVRIMPWNVTYYLNGLLLQKRRAKISSVFNLKFDNNLLGEASILIYS